MAAPIGGRIFAVMFERIIVGYAGDRAGRDAVSLAARLAAVSSARLTVVFPYHPLFATVSGDVAEERVRGELAALLGDDPALQSATYHWSTSSWPIRALHELAAYERAELIVFGSAPERLERRHVSLMERMVHGAPCAVAVAPEGYAEEAREPIQRIGVGFSDTEEGRAAIALGLRLAELTDGGARVIAGSGLGPALAGYAFSSPSLPVIEDQMYAETKASLEAVAAEMDGEDRMLLEVLRGDPCGVLVSASQNLDLLILGSRAYGPVRRALLGSVSADVMRAAHCPVLVLPRRSDATDTTGPVAEDAVARR